jgi:Ca-activated chloride channel family protein
MGLQWYQDIGIIEYILIAAFVVATVFYILRIRRIARALNTHYRWVFFKLPLRIIYFALLIIALLGPSFGFGKKSIAVVGKDIFIAVDLSLSMKATDIQPSRLDKIKYELSNIVNTLKSDRIGLVIFSSSAFMHCPLTYDKGALNLFTQILNTNLMPVGRSGTDFYAPLELVLKKYKEGNTTNNRKQQNEYAKIVVLFSDGEEFGDRYTDIIDQLKQNNIRVFTVGVGSLQGGKIPTSLGFKKDKKGKVVLSQLSTASLQNIAEQTNGRFFEVSDNRNDIPELINTIQEIKGQKLDVRDIDVSSNKYAYFAWAALALLFLDVLITVKVISL